MLKLIYGDQEIIKPGRLQRRKLGKNLKNMVITIYIKKVITRIEILKIH